jgi:hypothetical protein
LSLNPRRFFVLASSSGQGFDPQTPGRRFHAILLDIDHSPRHLLHAEHSKFYDPAGLCQLTTYLYPGGVFALWSNDPPDDEFLEALDSTFATSKAHVVTFHNPLQNCEAASTVYVARMAAASTKKHVEYGNEPDNKANGVSRMLPSTIWCKSGRGNG